MREQKSFRLRVWVSFVAANKSPTGLGILRLAGAGACGDNMVIKQSEPSRDSAMTAIKVSREPRSLKPKPLSLTH
jgi:hypothetical protein